MTNEDAMSQLVFEVKEAWELGICTCCANSYLLRLTNGQYLYLDSWKLTPFAETESFPKRNLRLTVDPSIKVLLSVESDGPLVPKRSEDLNRAAEDELSGSEYVLLDGDDLPKIWRGMLDAA